MIFGITSSCEISRMCTLSITTAASLLLEGSRTADSSCLIAKYKNIASVMSILLQSFHLQNSEDYYKNSAECSAG
jgi:hypothetical protein